MPQSAEDFINQLLAQMTPEEKIGQLNQFSASADLSPDLLR